MTKKATPENNRRNEILSAAFELFLENGYEKTSVRMISKKVGCEVGLVYYYFKTKEDVFESVLSAYFTQTEEELKVLSEQATYNSENNLRIFTEFAEEKAKNFRTVFPNTVHASVRCTVAEKITDLAEKYLEEMMQKTDKKDSFVWVFLARGICNAVFREDETYWETNKEKIMATAKTIVTARDSSSRRRDIPSFLL